MTIGKSIIGIVLFAVQIVVAVYFNPSIDLQIVTTIGAITLAYVLHKYFSKKYDSQ